MFKRPPALGAIPWRADRALTNGASKVLPPQEIQRMFERRLATFALNAEVDGERAAGVTVGLAESGDAATAYRAPPAHFEAASLRVLGADAETEYAHRVAPPAPGKEGQTFDLTLRAEPQAAVELVAENLDAATYEEVVLVETATGRQHDLQTGSETTIPINSDDGEVALQLLVGSADYVDEEATPEELTLHPPYPNPSSGAVTVEYALPEEADAQVAVYNALGQRVAVLEEAPRGAGSHQLQWNGGATLSSGVYFLRLEAGGQTETERLTIVR